MTQGFGASSGLGLPWKSLHPDRQHRNRSTGKMAPDGGRGGGGEGAYYITNTSQQRSRFQRKFIVFERSEGTLQESEASNYKG